MCLCVPVPAYLADGTSAAGVVEQPERLLCLGSVILLLCLETWMDPAATLAEVGDDGVDHGREVVLWGWDVGGNITGEQVG